MAAITLADVLSIAFGSGTYTSDWWLGLWDNAGEIVHDDYARVEITFDVGVNDVGAAYIYVASPATVVEFICPTTTVNGYFFANGETEEPSFYGNFANAIDTTDRDRVSFYPTDTGLTLQG